MNPTVSERETFLHNLRRSELLTNHQFRVVSDKLGDVQNPREIAKALATWKLLTKFQAKMLLSGRARGFFIGPYRILDQIGQGGMGRVYKAMHRTMSRVVALKVLAPQVMESERAHELFMHEVRAAAQLAHPNIVMAYDANEYHGRHYLAMEYVDGPNVEKYVRKHGTLPVGLACEIIFQTANGLQHAFEKGMVHRDIKPANLLLHEDSSTGTIQVKILDFGLARLHEPFVSGSSTVVVKDRTVMGTPDFLSPEQSRNVHAVDIRSDLYSLGCTFYFLLTGQVPFPGGTALEKLARQNEEHAQAIEEMRPDVPRHVRAIVKKLMAKDPAERFQTPDELMDALAPHAAPSAIEWPISPPTSATLSDQVVPAPATVEATRQAITEARPLSATSGISDADSALDWVDANRRTRRRNLWILGSGLATLATATTAMVWWLLS